MKISNSKKQLAKIISENGGWREGAEFAAQDSDGAIFFYKTEPTRVGRVWRHNGVLGGDWIECDNLLSNWHQTILSRDEYFHLYPVQDADGWIEWRGGECPLAEGTPIYVRHRDGAEIATLALGDWNVRWTHDDGVGDVVAYRLRTAEPDADGWIEWKGGECPVPPETLVICRLLGDHEWKGGCPVKAGSMCWDLKGVLDIIAYRLHKPEPPKSTAVGDGETNLAAKEELEVLEFEPTKPTIEQLASEYRNRKDCAERKQQEADGAMAEAEAKLAELVAAGKALGLEIFIAKEANNA